jgi:hypothetical protein
MSMKPIFPASASDRTLASYRVEPDRNLRIEEYEGVIHFSDIRALAEAVSADPGWSPEFDTLIDFSRATLELSSNDVLRLALLLRQERYRSQGWMAFAVGDATSFCLVRMLGYWSRMTERSRIFRDRSEAEEWLVGRGGYAPMQWMAVS